jgi:hypothetical protein
MKLSHLLAYSLIPIFFPIIAFAEAPAAVIQNDLNNDIELRGAVINAGASIGGFKGGGLEMETSIGTVHGGVKADSVDNNILIYGLLGGISVVNAAVTWQGNLCSKVAIGSIGASTCTYGDRGNIGSAISPTSD